MAPMNPLLASELDDKLRRFQQAQRELYDYLGVVRREGGRGAEPLRAKHYNHSGGLTDIPSPYPEVLDYRAKKWIVVDRAHAGQEEIHVRIREHADWTDSNIIRFHLYSIWDGEHDPYIHAVGSHLPKPEELEYANPDKVSRAERGELVFGDRCLLLLDSANGSSEIKDYQEYFS